MIYSIALIVTILFEFSKKYKKVKEKLYEHFLPSMTYWQLLHFLTRIILGYFSPDCYIIITIIDVLWETFEKYVLKIHDWRDLIYNICGLSIGVFIANY